MKTKKIIPILTIAIILSIITISVLHYYVIIDLPVPWSHPEPLTREILSHSLKIGTQFMLNNQKPEGNFNYQYNWKKKELIEGDNEVRQAGVMWSLALIYQDQPTPEIAAAVEKAMNFFEKHSELTNTNGRYIVYPGKEYGRMNAVALCTMTYIDYLRAAGSHLLPDKLAHYQKLLDEYLKFLIDARMKSGLLHGYYDISNGKPFGKSQPYADGETLLAFIKLAKYMNRLDLIDMIIESADAGYQLYVRKALQEDPDSALTKGYYQWSSMAYYELATSGWPDIEKYGGYVLELADWMIDVHKTLKRTRNTAYAYEGIIHAHELAVQRNETERAEKYAKTIAIGLRKLTSWQVGSPIANRFIRRDSSDDPLAVGGVQSHRRDPVLRIDTTQHQMHAVILARRYVYK